MTNLANFESVLSLIDKTIEPLYLSSTQEIVLRETWNGKTYSEIACEHNYDAEYIKTVGCSLWKNLSNAFNEQINKNNFVPLMRQRTIEFIEKKSFPTSSLQSLSETINIKQEKLSHWTTAPHIKNFFGRESELRTLESWTQEPDCQCIIVSGMVGCGKTTLVTKFAQKIEHQFDYVLWFSLRQMPSLETLLINYLAITNNDYANTSKPVSLELSFLLLEFIERLKQKKILLIIDDLQYILNDNQANPACKQKFQEYSQFLRAIATTNHRSLLVATSRIRPAMLDYYSSNQVNFLDLRGFNLQTTKIFLSSQNSNLLDEKMQLSLSEILQSNPQLLKIVSSHLHDFSTENTEQVLQDSSFLEEVVGLLEQELQYLSDLNKEIIYWLAIACSPISLMELNQNFERSQRRAKLLQNINYLVKRSLVLQDNGTYSLMPVMKNYLRRKLVRTTLANSSQ